MSSPKTICFFSTYFIPHIGGIENYTFHLAKSLVEKGYKVIVVSANTERLPDHGKSDGIIIYRLPVFYFTRQRYPIVKPSLQYFTLIRELIRENIDIVIINTRFYLLSLTGLYFAKKIDKPAIVIEHSTGHFSISNKILDKLGEVYEHALTLIIKTYRPHYYGVSNACGQWLKHFGLSADGVLYNGIDATYRIQEKFDFKDRYKIAKGTLIVSFIGRLIEEKGIFEFIKAIDELKKDNDPRINCRFFIAGSGPLSDSVEERTEKDETVTYLGPISFDMVMNLLDQTDIFVFPTNMPEGLPTILLEAGLSKCAVISTGKGGCVEIIPDQTYGIIINSYNHTDIKEAIIRFIDDPDYRKSASLKLYEKVIKEFSWSQLSSNFIDLLHL